MSRLSLQFDVAKLGKVLAKGEGDIDTGIRAALFKVSERVIKGTPADTGRAKGNWLPSVDAPAQGVVETTDKSGEIAIGNARDVLSDRIIGKAYYLANNLPYIGVLEYGHSQQAPQGMVRLALQDFDAMLDKQLKKATKGVK